MSAPVSSPPPEKEALPRGFGRYLLFDHIGRGGMADIYLARAETELGGGRLVVVKQILEELSDDEGFAQMLIAEAKLAAKLNHANVVQVFDLGREGKRLYIAMEYVEGFDLNELLKRLSRYRIPLPAEFAFFIVREVLRGLDYAHRARDEAGRPLDVVHRDVSPSNVLISFEGEVKLCDFGIARALGAGGERHEPDARSIERSRITGKSAYMAPEHARGEEIDQRAGVFAAAILLWELCAGGRMYRGSEAQMLAQARVGAVPPLPERGLPEHQRLQALLARALELDPDRRFQSAAEMLHAVEEYAIGAGLLGSQLRFGAFLTEHFAEEIVATRRKLERVAAGETGKIAAVEIDAVEAAALEADATPTVEDEAPGPALAERTSGGPGKLGTAVALGILIVGLAALAYVLLTR